MSRLKIVSAEEVPERYEIAGQDGSVHRQAYTSAGTDYPTRPAQPIVFPTAQVIAALTAISAILGVRMCLLLAGGGALWLAFLGMTAPNAASLWAQAIFSGTVVLPMVWLSATRRI